MLTLRKMTRAVAAMTVTLLLAAGGASCSTSKKTTAINSRPGNTVNQHIDTRHLSKEQKRLLDVAEEWEGTPYRYGGTEKGRGVDCSGFVMRVYQDALGKKLPRNSARQAECCTPVKENDTRAGDLVFFATGKDKSKVSHVGMMVDSERFIHASSSKGVVVSTMKNPYYIRTFLMYGRVPEDIGQR